METAVNMSIMNTSTAAERGTHESWAQLDTVSGMGAGQDPLAGRGCWDAQAALN